MSKSNLAVKEELENVAAEDVIIINQNEQENYRPSKDKEIRVNNNLSYLIMKKIVDIIAGILGTILLVPLIAVVWFIRICLHENDGPLFFEQIRIGKNGTQFRMYKFRTMVMEADEKLYRYLEENPEAKKEYKKYKKLKHDPRITKLGNILRKTSLDEFPQFVNILKGEMSLVGPRPYLYREKEDLGEYYYNSITKVKPGITGYWQVNGRNDVDFEERAYMDPYYIERRGIVMDLKIILKTFLKIFKKSLQFEIKCGMILEHAILLCSLVRRYALM